MPLLMLDGWPLTDAEAKTTSALKDDDKQAFWLNSQTIESIAAMERGGRPGYAVTMASGRVHFLPLTQAEMAQLIRMSVNEAKLG